MRCPILCLLAAVTSAGLTGCSSLAALQPPTSGYADGTESSDPWVMQAAAEGRRDIAPEDANDPLNLRRFFMSQKARDIETNVGIR